MLEDFLNNSNIPYEVNVSLKKKTWIHRGGFANYFVTPKNLNQLKNLCEYLYKNEILFDLIGHTSNLYFLNHYNPNIVITTRLCNCVIENNDSLICDCGVSVSRLARDCVKKGICGFEYLTELPGTIGAAIYNNSSCKNNSIASLVSYVDFLSVDGKMSKLTSKQLNFSFRNSALKEKKLNGIILKAYLKVNKGDALRLCEIARINKINRDRIFSGHYKNLGCTFDKPHLSIQYQVLLKIVRLFCIILGKDNRSIDEIKKNILLKITGYNLLAPYICSQSYLIFIWKDDKADELFPMYVEFMGKILNTKMLEIEIKS